jgi:hypothetical protein
MVTYPVEQLRRPVEAHDLLIKSDFMPEARLPGSRIVLYWHTYNKTVLVRVDFSKEHLTSVEWSMIEDICNRYKLN